jgi:hypothetical protein
LTAILRDDRKSDSGAVMPTLQPQSAARKVARARKPSHLTRARWGRFTYKLTWAEIVKLYRLTLASLRATRNRDTTSVRQRRSTASSRRRESALSFQMRWGLIPYCWDKPLKEMRLATFDARAETVATKLMFRDAFKS